MHPSNTCIAGTVNCQFLRFADAELQIVGTDTFVATGAPDAAADRVLFSCFDNIPTFHTIPADVGEYVPGF
jgi:hypothetical protein